ncbi:unnamed protein product [Arctia plantaginis]|uniref:Uncharacterized protein n=1 Tax=Arctia plantaginis TaxID=874455 RepID=A0A8S1B4U9_ARCPL|nr:unnamed protein product [Arctia plantaginis]CAB3251650.1 unnamed protein product [Arctia plantaginis]
MMGKYFGKSNIGCREKKEDKVFAEEYAAMDRSRECCRTVLPRKRQNEVHGNDCQCSLARGTLRRNM